MILNFLLSCRKSARVLASARERNASFKILWLMEIHNYSGMRGNARTRTRRTIKFVHQRALHGRYIKCIACNSLFQTRKTHMHTRSLFLVFSLFCFLFALLISSNKILIKPLQSRSFLYQLLLILLFRLLFVSLAESFENSGIK